MVFVLQEPSWLDTSIEFVHTKGRSKEHKMFSSQTIILNNFYEYLIGSLMIWMLSLINLLIN